MSHSHRFLMAACFACVFPFTVFAEAPVVDDSENFAIIDDQVNDNQHGAFERPLAHAPHRSAERDGETAFAQDSIDVKNTTASNAVVLDKLQGLQQEIQELRGQLEVQAHDFKLLQQQQLAFYKDLDARIRNEPLKPKKTEPVSTTDLSMPSKDLAKAPVSPSDKIPLTIPPAANPGASINPADEQISYLAAYDLIKNKKYDDALNAMQTFVAQHPQSGYAANAHYWLGELYMLKKTYPEAISQFEMVTQLFPSSNKAPASLLKIGYALAAQGKTDEAIVRLQQVMKTYPNTNTAQLAKVKLESLGSRQ